MSSKHLGITLSETHAEFSIFNNGSLHFNKVSEYQGKSDQDRKDALRDLMAGIPELNQDFENITLAWCDEKSTLVPASVFAESSPKQLFQLCFGKEVDTTNIDHNRIFELSVVNVYAIPTWVKSLFVIKYPQVILQHAGTHQIREALNKEAFYTKATVVLHENYFRLTLVKHNNLEFYSSFAYQTHEDVIYHLNFVLQQKELLDEKGSIQIAFQSGPNYKVSEEIVEGLEKIQHLKKMKKEVIDQHLPKSQLLCV